MVYLRLYDLNGNLAAILENAYELELQSELDGAELLSFTLPCDDPKAMLVKHDEEIIYADKRYIITDIEDTRDESGVSERKVTCELAYIELLGTIKHGDFLIDRKTAGQGLSGILAGTRWSVGVIEGDLEMEYSITAQNQTALWFVRQWAVVTGREVQWDSINRKVNLLLHVGTDRGTGFWYRRNLRSIARTMIPPEATVLWPYGAGGLNISVFNAGKEYLEDYSWYTSQGIPLEVARVKYKKEYVWRDDRYLLTSNLYAAALQKLAQLSQPTISYECTVLDLSALTGQPQETFSLGDYVRVYDDDLGIDIQTRILRMKVYPQEPWRNEVELSYIIPGLEGREERSIAAQVEQAQAKTILATNPNAIALNTTHQYPMQIALTTFAATNAQVGLMIIGQASAAMTLTITFWIAGVQVSRTIQHSCAAGWNTIGIPFLIPQIQAGSMYIQIQAYTSAGTFSIAANDLQVFIVATNILGGLSAKLPHAEWEEVLEWVLITEQALAGLQVPTPAMAEETITRITISEEIVVEVV